MIVEVRAFRRYKDTRLDPADPIIRTFYWPLMDEDPISIAIAEDRTMVISYFPEITWDRMKKHYR